MVADPSEPGEGASPGASPAVAAAGLTSSEKQSLWSWPGEQEASLAVALST